MKKSVNEQLMENIDKGIRTEVKKAFEDHKKAGLETVVWENGKVKIIPSDQIKIQH